LKVIKKNVKNTAETNKSHSTLLYTVALFNLIEQLIDFTSPWSLASHSLYALTLCDYLVLIVIVANLEFIF
jgi:hypothetical protein